MASEKPNESRLVLVPSESLAGQQKLSLTELRWRVISAVLIEGMRKNLHAGQKARLTCDAILIALAPRPQRTQAAQILGLVKQERLIQN
jgi:hypothetical protein